MFERDIGFLMDDSLRDLRSARRFLDEETYPKSISDSYFSTFYAAKAVLLHLGIKTKSHKSVQIGIDAAVDEGRLSQDMRGVLALLGARRNEAVYRYAKRNWTEEHAVNSLHMAQRFVETVRQLFQHKGSSDFD